MERAKCNMRPFDRIASLFLTSRAGCTRGMPFAGPWARYSAGPGPAKVEAAACRTILGQGSSRHVAARGPAPRARVYGDSVARPC